jgi:hypothetical protein
MLLDGLGHGTLVLGAANVEQERRTGPDPEWEFQPSGESVLPRHECAEAG